MRGDCESVFVKWAFEKTTTEKSIPKRFAMLLSQPRGQRGVATIAALALVVTSKYLWNADGGGDEGLKAVRHSELADIVKGTPAPADSGTVASSRRSQILQVYIFTNPRNIHINCSARNFVYTSRSNSLPYASFCVGSFEVLLPPPKHARNHSVRVETLFGTDPPL